jgi:DNA-binding NtrC family response regulator
MRFNILVVEDDALIQKIIGKNLKGNTVDFVSNKDEAFKKLDSKRYDIAFVDLMLGENDNYSGLRVIEKAKSKGIYVVVISGSGNSELINRVYDLGANDYYFKGNENTVISDVLRKYESYVEINNDKEKLFSNDFITTDPKTQKEILNALKFAKETTPILILGDSGTGKTTLAKLIHKYSKRKGNYVDLNCAAYNSELLEIELFGHTKSAFTGASEKRAGKIKQADNGTLFLDEIGAMSIDMQQKLLKAVEEKYFYPVGSDKKEYSNFRIISATLENIEELVKSKKLRKDFLNRIDSVRVFLPPLSKRRDDILILIEKFTESKRQLSFSPKAIDFLLKYSWPGNVRELKNMIDFFILNSKGNIDVVDIENYIKSNIKNEQMESSDSFLNIPSGMGLDDYLDDIAYRLIKKEFSRTKRVNDVLKRFKISTRRFYSLMKKYEGKDGEKRD